MPALRLVLGDQLTPQLASLRDYADGDLVLMAEVWDEATYVRHHKKKIAFIFAAMRHFAKALEEQGLDVRYVTLDDPDNAGSLAAEVSRALTLARFDRLVLTHPGEYRVLAEMQQWSQRFGLPVEIRDDDRFLCSINQFADWATGKKQLRMEFFYRIMRRRHQVLMEADGEKPLGGKWNFDALNRGRAEPGLLVPAPTYLDPDGLTREVLALVEVRFASHFGSLSSFGFAVTRNGALEVLDQFIKQRLSSFGTYQDAMVQGEPWMFHCHTALYLNVGLLTPLECVQRAEAAYHAREDVALNCVEGFVRQILGWREFVRGIYWLRAPGYGEENFLEATRALPELYWTANTQMNCLRQCVSETRDNAYAHHIQRLMVLGNFALLAGVDPAQVNEWFLIVYADAFEWVEQPNVTGMALFADGGLLASKPYAASGAYINKMSDYCQGCRYQVATKNGPKACPFNYLYWDFLERNAEKLSNNQRLAMPYRTLVRMSDDKRAAIRADSQRFLKALDDGQLV